MQGKITDKKTKEPVYNAQIFASDQFGTISDPPVGTTSNFDGAYSFDPPTAYATFKHLSYQPVTFAVPKNGILNVQLDADTYELPVVEITYDIRPWYRKYQTQTLALIIAAAALTAGYYAFKKN